MDQKLFLTATDPQEAKAAIAAEYPDFPISTIALEKQGMDNHTFVVNGEWIFRFPRDGGWRYENEIKFLNLLKGKTNLPVPELEFIGRKRLFLGYRRLGGENLGDHWEKISPAGRAMVCGQLAEFQYRVHNLVDSAELEGLKFPAKPKWWKDPSDMSDRLDKSDMGYRDKPWFSFALKCLDRYAGYLKDTSSCRLQHHDLHGQNLVMDLTREELCGAFDCGDVVVADLHQDFTPFIWTGYEAMDQLAAAYEKLSGLKLDRRRIKDYKALDRLFDLVDGNFEENAEKDLTWIAETDKKGLW